MFSEQAPKHRGADQNRFGESSLTIPSGGKSEVNKYSIRQHGPHSRRIHNWQQRVAIPNLSQQSWD